jgi:sigma-54 dependent transcriptional regulator, acetoin dehydrogenase operon transcriptional activator AcoR
MLAGIIGSDEGLREVMQRASRLAEVDATVLIEGEAGVGKQVFARAIHDASQNRHGPFVALSCAGLSREILASVLFGCTEAASSEARRAGMIGKIEKADGGTLFLDEISELPLQLQPYLLRVLEGVEVYPLGSARPRQVRFRLISACNQPLRDQSNQGRFRADLFYRVSVTSLHIPPLRARIGDLPLLVPHFAARAAQRHAVRIKPFAPEVLRAFADYAWPGNVRELMNVVEAMLLLAGGDVVELDVLPAELASRLRSTGEADAPSASSGSPRPCPGSGGLRRAEREAISAAIRNHQGNLTQAARDLRISRSTLYLKLKKHALDPVLMQARLA